MDLPANKDGSKAMKAQRLVEVFFYSNGMTLTLGRLFLVINVLVAGNGFDLSKAAVLTATYFTGECTFLLCTLFLTV